MPNKQPSKRGKEVIVITQPPVRFTLEQVNQVARLIELLSQIDKRHQSLCQTK